MDYRQAEPKDILQKRYQQFQRRLARHYINQTEEGNGESEAPTDSSQRQPLGVTAGSSHIRQQQTTFAGSSRSSQAQGLRVTSNFSIFSDAAVANDVENSNLDGERGRERTWDSLPREKVARKENDGKSPSPHIYQL
jgi:hypothetical protein